VGLVYHGTDAPGTIAGSAAPPAWPSPFFFTAGSIRPARGLEDAIRAIARLRSRQLPVPLVIAGRADATSHRYEQRMRRLAARPGAAERIRAARPVTGEGQ